MQQVDEIMKKIRKGFTGEASRDIPYLQQKMDEYKEHDLSADIIRECSRLLYDIAASSEEMQKESENIEETHKHMKEIRVYVEQGEVAQALRVSEELVKRADNNSMYIDNEKCEFYSFSEFFEEIMVKEFMHSGREIVKANFPFSDIYYQHGMLLMGQNKIKEAQDVLAKARRWNPVSAPIAFAYMDTFRMMGKMDEYAELNREIFPYLYKGIDVAQCYSHFAGYYAGKEEWRVAAGCCQLSLKFEPGEKTVEDLLKEIKKKAGAGFKIPSKKEMEHLADKYEIRVSPNSNIINLAVGMGEQFMNQQALEAALYCFEIVYGLTQDKKIGELVKKMRILAPMG